MVIICFAEKSADKIISYLDDAEISEIFDSRSFR